MLQLQQQQLNFKQTAHYKQRCNFKYQQWNKECNCYSIEPNNEPQITNNKQSMTNHRQQTKDTDEHATSQRYYNYEDLAVPTPSSEQYNPL